MANNRLYLKCKRTGEKVMLAKYYPSTGWYVQYEDLSRRLNEMFHKDNFGDVTWGYAQDEGIKSQGGEYDGGAHELEYEEQ